MLLLTVLVSGRVQHVGYRSRVVTMARTLDLRGYVKNLADGRVMVVAEGNESDLERFCRAIRIEDPLIRVEEMQVQVSSPKGAWDDFYKITGEGETDSRLDTATVFLKELIVVVKDGFVQTNLRLGSMDGKLDEMGGKLDKIAKAQEKVAESIDVARKEIVFEVKELRKDLAGRLDGRLLRAENAVDIRNGMKFKPT